MGKSQTMDNWDSHHWEQYQLIAEYCLDSAERYLLLVSSEKYRSKPRRQKPLKVKTDEELEALLDVRERALLRQELKTY